MWANAQRDGRPQNTGGALCSVFGYFLRCLTSKATMVATVDTRDIWYNRLQKR